ncbi:Radical SAM domain-containing protein [Candidatus Magnetomorum sp. HK-1]|nr:Radical SAM domain-containing protein [Candidatus Magnetomorum sp. HK-1]
MTSRLTSFLTYSSEIEDLQVLFHPYQSSWIIVNSTASDIIDQIARNQPLNKIAKSLTHEYEIDYQQALSDVKTVYQNLVEKKFEIQNIESPQYRIPQLKSLFIHITRRCNLKCPHCYVTSSNDVSQELPTPIIMKLIDDLTKHGGDSLTISGGEPLLHPDIYQILSHASKRLTVRLLTNGTKIYSEMAKFLADHKIYVQISIDGSTSSIHDTIRGQGCFEKIMKAIEKLQKYGAGEHLNLCSTLMQHNQNDWEQMIALAEQKDVPLLRFLHLREVGRANNHPKAQALSSKEYEQFIAHISSLQKDKQKKVELTCGMSGLLLKMPEEFQAEDIWCPVGRMMVVDTNGNVYPCVLMMRDQYLLGNIFEQKLISILKSKSMKEVCNILSNRRYSIDKCRCCSFRNLCQAGCMGQALDHCDNVMATDNFCQYRKKAYAKAFDHLLNMANTK